MSDNEHSTPSETAPFRAISWEETATGLVQALDAAFEERTHLEVLNKELLDALKIADEELQRAGIWREEIARAIARTEAVA